MTLAEASDLGYHLRTLVLAHDPDGTTFYSQGTRPPKLPAGIPGLVLSLAVEDVIEKYPQTAEAETAWAAESWFASFDDPGMPPIPWYEDV